jgi:hypothetical protein
MVELPYLDPQLRNMLLVFAAVVLGIWLTVVSSRSKLFKALLVLACLSVIAMAVDRFWIDLGRLW